MSEGVGGGATADCTVNCELVALVTVGVASTAVGAVLFANGAAVALTAGAPVRFGLTAFAAVASGVAAGVADAAVADVSVAGLLAKSSSVATMSKPESTARVQPSLWNIKSSKRSTLSVQAHLQRWHGCRVYAICIAEFFLPVLFS